MNWLENAWDTSCSLSVFNAVEKHVKYAIKATAVSAPHELIFAHTGWKRTGGKWEYLLPGNPSHDVHLSGKMKSYQAANECTADDIAVLAQWFCQYWFSRKVSESHDNLVRPGAKLRITGNPAATRSVVALTG